jgi:Na+-transporting methylmalonyl-CoA/oxaloacetate decarboxylase gamma subunit
MPEKLPEAAMLAVTGVAMVMTGLTILMLAVMVLCRLVSGDKDNKEKSAPNVLQRQGISKESIAAMAVAMALAMEEQKTASTIGHDEAPVPRFMVSSWAAAGRERLMRSRTKTGHKWRRR